MSPSPFKLQPGQDMSNYLMEQELKRQEEIRERLEMQCVAVHGETEKMRVLREEDDAHRAAAKAAAREQAHRARAARGLVVDMAPMAGEGKHKAPQKAFELERGDKPSERWVSVARSGMAEYHTWDDEMKGGNRTEKLLAIRQRRAHNTTSRLVLGDEQIEYLTELHRGEKEAAGKADMEEIKMNRVNQRRRKEANTRTTYSLGEFKLDYVQTSTLPDPTADMRKYRGVIDPEQGKKLRMSTLTAMYEESADDRIERLQSTSKMDMGPKNLPSKEEVDKMKARAKQMKKDLTRNTLTIGEKDYKAPMTTDYKARFFYDYETYPQAKRDLIIDPRELRKSQLPWEYKVSQADYVSVSQGAFADANNWDFQAVHEGQKEYLDRFKAKDKGAASQFALGTDSAFY